MGKDKALEKVKELKIYYYGIIFDIEKINHLCEICLQKNIRFYKHSSYKQIIMDRPKQRYVNDLTFIPIELYKNTNFKYLGAVF